MFRPLSPLFALASLATAAQVGYFNSDSCVDPFGMESFYVYIRPGTNLEPYGRGEIDATSDSSKYEGDCATTFSLVLYMHELDSRRVRSTIRVNVCSRDAMSTVCRQTGRAGQHSTPCIIKFDLQSVVDDDGVPAMRLLFIPTVALLGRVSLVIGGFLFLSFRAHMSRNKDWGAEDGKSGIRAAFSL